jgi:hypothetical protein
MIKIGEFWKKIVCRLRGHQWIDLQEIIVAAQVCCLDGSFVQRPVASMLRKCRRCGMHSVLLLPGGPEYNAMFDGVPVTVETL